MAEVDYTAIAEAIVNILKADDSTKTVDGNNTTIVSESEFNQNADQCPWVGVFLDRWDTPPEEEFIGGSNPRTTLLTLELWLFEFALENKVCSEKRQKLLTKVKEVLKANRTLGGTVLVTRFEGGEFDNATKSGGFFKGVSIKLECEVRE